MVSSSQTHCKIRRIANRGAAPGAADSNDTKIPAPAPPTGPASFSVQRLRTPVLAMAHHSRAVFLHDGDIGRRACICRSHVLRTASGMPLRLVLAVIVLTMSNWTVVAGAVDLKTLVQSAERVER